LSDAAAATAAAVIGGVAAVALTFVAAAGPATFLSFGFVLIRPTCRAAAGLLILKAATGRPLVRELHTCAWFDTRETGGRGHIKIRDKTLLNLGGGSRMGLRTSGESK